MEIYFLLEQIIDLEDSFREGNHTENMRIFY